MEMFNKLDVNKPYYSVNRKKDFVSLGRFKETTVLASFKFAYDMTFAKRGEFRDHRSGGTQKRINGEVFKDAFQGKLAECALYNRLYNKYSLTKPNFEVWPSRKWDEEDLIIEIENKKISVKSTKAFGNLLMLESKDYNSDGVYTPNLKKRGGGQYDYFVLVRMEPFCEEIMRMNHLLYCEKADYNMLQELIMSKQWQYDIPGYITREEFRYIIRNEFIIPKNAILNGTTIIDADNYYIQAGDLHDINTL